MSDVLSSSWAFVNRHRKKVIALVVAGALGAGGYYYVKKMLKDGIKQFEEMGKDLQFQMLAGQFRDSERTRVKSECEPTISTFVSVLRSRLYAMTDPRPVTVKIKEYRRNKKADNSDEALGDELWENLKNISLSRLISSIYATTLLSLLVRLMLHVLGRYSLEESLRLKKDQVDCSDGKPADPELPIITAKVRETFMFLASNQLANGDGIDLLLRDVHQGVKVASKGWLMGSNTKVSKSDMRAMVRAIRQEIEGRSVSPGPDGEVETLPNEAQTWLVECLLNDSEQVDLVDEVDALTVDQKAVVRDMLNETMDMVESPFFASALDDALSAMFGRLENEINEMRFDASNETVSDSDAVFMLAKVVVHLKQHTGDVMRTPATASGDAPVDGAGGLQSTLANDYLQDLSSLPSVEELCDCVFGPEEQGTGLLGDELGGLADGLSNEDMQALTSLLGGLAGGDGGDMDFAKLLTGPDGGEDEMMKMFGSIFNNAVDPTAPQPQQAGSPLLPAPQVQQQS